MGEDEGVGGRVARGGVEGAPGAKGDDIRGGGPRARGSLGAEPKIEAERRNRFSRRKGGVWVLNFRRCFGFEMVQWCIDALRGRECGNWRGKHGNGGAALEGSRLFGQPQSSTPPPRGVIKRDPSIQWFIFINR